ncbi:hypothetical protein LOTGIDRAFT_153308 [Lottia gigantea]|uniref:Uncharacterized protein n=1 Tax=Lottia gigantea TaxID=225164 RepID=V4AFF8_LOTGI|nr:hypothetical protein LOTGIDRAFT_153308 [Lottia gigantea]ESO93835.1 hypothetical protein LOTGIDRAFT_153308 [Lottia gigantea]
MRNETVILVKSTLEMSEVIQELMTKLILMRITVIHTEIASKYSVEKVSILEDDFAVLINSNHPSLKKQFSDSLQEAAVHTAKNSRFCLEIDLTETMKSWYTENRDAFTSCDDIHSMKMRRTRLYVTNYSIYSHYFDCSPKWIIFLGLCWLVSAPCYFIFRKLTCSDIRVVINGEITLMTNMLPDKSESTRSHELRAVPWAYYTLIS